MEGSEGALMACNLCHKSEGHTETCPTLIRVEWTSSGSVWERLARTVFELYVSAERKVLGEYGDAQDEQLLDAFVRYCKQALEDGDPYTVLELIRIREG